MGASLYGRAAPEDAEALPGRFTETGKSPARIHKFRTICISSVEQSLTVSQEAVEGLHRTVEVRPLISLCKRVGYLALTEACGGDRPTSPTSSLRLLRWPRSAAARKSPS
eukprot:1743609-Rhodomonas_salina.2